MLATHDVDERNKIIGENLRKYRLLKGLTQDELAEGICSISQLSKIENGKTYVKRALLKQMAERLSVTIERIESTDALQEELSDTLQLAKDALTTMNYDKAYELVSDVIRKSEEFGYPNHMIEGILLQCRLLIVKKQFEEVIRIASKAIQDELFMESTQKVRLLFELGHAHQLNGNMVAAYDYYMRADEGFEQTEGDRETRLKIFIELSRCNLLMSNYRTALRYTEKAEKLAAEMKKHVNRLRSSYVKADLLERLGESDKAVSLYTAALKEATDNSYLLDVAIINHNFGCLYKNRGDMGQALAYLQRGKQLFELMNEEIYLCASYQRIAEIYISEGDTSGALESIEQIFEITDRVTISTYREKAEALRLIAQIKIAEDDLESYIEHMQKVLSIYEQNYVIVEAYDVAIELADVLYQRENPMAVEIYRKAIEFNQKNIQIGLRR
ncbi:MAG: helix-turn-helix domain-containing protein [Tumebacillaceae bacterium]